MEIYILNLFYEGYTYLAINNAQQPDYADYVFSKLAKKQFRIIGRRCQH